MCTNTLSYGGIDYLIDGNLYRSNNYTVNTESNDSKSDYRLTEAEILKKYDEGYCRIIGYRQPSGGLDSITAELGKLVKIEIQQSQFIIYLDKGLIKQGPLTYEHDTGWGFGTDIIPIPIAFQPIKAFHYFSYIEDGKRKTIVLDGNNEYNKKRFDKIFEHMKSPKSNACFVATAVYDDPMCYQLNVLRNWRDIRLTKSINGRLFIKLYYKHGMKLAAIVNKNDMLKSTTKLFLDKLIRRLEKKY